MSVYRRVLIGSTVAFILLGLGLADRASAQDWKGNGRLAGEVLDWQGNPLPGAVVKLDLPERGGGPEPIATDKKGRWAYFGLVAGRWNVDIAAEGHQLKSMYANVSSVARMPPMKIQLEKAEPVGPPPEVLEAIEKGDAAYKEGKYAEARMFYERLLDLRPDLGSTLFMQIARCHKQEGNIEKELELLGRVLEAEPANAEVRMLMAMEAIEGGLLERGMELLGQIDETKIVDPDVFFNIGVSFVNKSRPEDAVVYFTKAIALKPDYLDGYFQRALTYFGLQKYPECRADFQKVLELSPEGPQADTAKKVLEQLPAE